MRCSGSDIFSKCFGRQAISTPWVPKRPQVKKKTWIPRGKRRMWPGHVLIGVIANNSRLRNHRRAAIRIRNTLKRHQIPEVCFSYKWLWHAMTMYVLKNGKPETPMVWHHVSNLFMFFMATWNKKIKWDKAWDAPQVVLTLNVNPSTQVL
jgi:hypothetical protein